MTVPDPLPPERLLRRCDTARFDFATTAELADLAEAGDALAVQQDDRLPAAASPR